MTNANLKERYPLGGVEVRCYLAVYPQLSEQSVVGVLRRSVSQTGPSE